MLKRRENTFLESEQIKPINWGREKERRPQLTKYGGILLLSELVFLIILDEIYHVIFPSMR